MTEPTVTRKPAPIDPKALLAEIRVEDNPARSRYEARLRDRVLGFLDYTLDRDGKGIVLVHTEVLADAEGMGVGSRLAKGALEDVRARGLRLTVDCRFVAAYLKRHPGEFDDLLGA